MDFSRTLSETPELSPSSLAQWPYIKIDGSSTLDYMVQGSKYYTISGFQMLMLVGIKALHSFLVGSSEGRTTHSLLFY